MSITDALKRGADTTTEAMNAAADIEAEERRQNGENLALSKVIGKQLIDFSELIISIEADENGRSFYGNFGDRDDCLYGVFKFGIEEEDRRNEDLDMTLPDEYRSPTAEIRITINHDGFSALAKDLPYRAEAGQFCSNNDLGNIDKALDFFAEWAGRVAPHMIPRIEEALLIQNESPTTQPEASYP